jgi:uncharacterized protein (TIGR02466 family)
VSSFLYFSSPIYAIEKPEFLDVVKEVSEEYLKKSRPLQQDEIYPVAMTENYFEDSRLSKFAEYIGVSAWDILKEQGYNVQNKNVAFTEMWTQEHRKHSLMEQHTHGYGSQIIGFYFIDVPEKSSRVLFHDPRPGKIQSELYEANETEVTIASRTINFEPKPGLLIFANSWLPHSFSRHASDEPLTFTHFNLTVVDNQFIQVDSNSSVEVV